eukprot:Em0022g494a
MADEGIQVKVFKTGDFVLCKWECHECDADDEGKESEENSEKWLPARLGKCSDNGKWDVFWLTRKDRVLVSELIDGEPSMSHGVVQSDLRPIDERKTTVLKAKGVRGGGSACWAYFTEPVHKDTLKRITYCCVQNEKGEQCSQALNVTAASTGSMINHLSAKHGICLQQGLSSSASSSAASSKSVRQEKCDELFSKSYARESTAWKSKFSALCKFLTTDMRPINLAQGKGFKEFCAVMDPRFCIPNAITINAQILREYTAMKERVCKALQLECPSNIHDQKMVSTTIDCWSRLDQKGFFGVTAHWITEDFHMRAKHVSSADDDFATFMSTSYQGEGSSSSGTSKVDASRDLTKELAQYSKIAAQPLKDDPLDWWRVERKRFPELAKVARVVLATPATSAPTERVFSKLGRVCARERAHMNPIMADAITFLASNRTWK